MLPRDPFLKYSSMPFLRTGYLICLTLLIMVYCRPEKRDRAAQLHHTTSNLVEQAKRFGIANIESGHYLFVFGDRDRPADTTARFILSQDTHALSKKYCSHYIIRTP